MAWPFAAISIHSAALFVAVVDGTIIGIFRSADTVKRNIIRMW